MTEALSQSERTLLASAQELDEFSKSELASHAGVKRSTTEKFLTQWVKDHKVVNSRREGRVYFYRLCQPKEAATDAKRPTRAELQSVDQNMWTAIRKLRPNFTALDVSLMATNDLVKVSERQAHDYCRLLIRAEVLAAGRKAVPGKRSAKYRLIRDLGPMPPTVKRVSMLHDPNTETVLPLAQGGAR